MHVLRKFIFIGWFRHPPQKNKKKNKNKKTKQKNKTKKTKKKQKKTWFREIKLISLFSYTTSQLKSPHILLIMLPAINSSPCIIPVMYCRYVIYFLRLNFSIYT